MSSYGLSSLGFVFTLLISCMFSQWSPAVQRLTYQFLTFDSNKWPRNNLSLQFPYTIKYKSYEYKEN